MAKTWKIAGINFDHQHMGDLLRMAHEHPNAEIAGISDEDGSRMAHAAARFSIPPERVFTDYRKCIEETKPDLVVLCPATARHAEWTVKVAPLGTHVLMEKPFASTLAQADEMIAALKKTGKELAVNWPLRWYPPHVTTKRLIDEGAIGDVVEVHYYDGNGGPLRHGADKSMRDEATVRDLKKTSWFYKKEAGGGSLQDYLAYGTTLGTWFMGGRKPIDITCMTFVPEGLEVDEHSVTIARYEKGLSKFETRWGTFNDPWIRQPQPKCGFVVVGTHGNISSYDYEKTVRVQDETDRVGHDVPVLELKAPEQNPIQYVLDRLERGAEIEGPLSPRIARIGQQIVDSAALSARLGKTVALVE